ncbi:hypothetical protein [Gluconobacter oxydans]|uniref:hypothetical protein n=1 Tax=Gluconobacter oxydans TaxID=442 RepID=UPI00209E86F4|nr:hypothetical protein [Gluconobacter oxydans]MCP1249992.1 hypothetical protein [Gluconobacter oxydans]
MSQTDQTTISKVLCGVTVEIFTYPNGEALLRTVDTYPVNGNDWHGPYKDAVCAEADFVDRNAPPVITPEDLRRGRLNGTIAQTRDGAEMMLTMDRWTGGSCLTSFIVRPEGQV